MSVLISGQLTVVLPETLLQLERPLFLSPVSAGFPSPAEDSAEQYLDLNTFLIRNKSATFFCRVKGDSMKDVAINDGDILIVDRSIEPVPGQIVVAILDGDFTVKRMVRKGTRWELHAENDQYPPIAISENMDFKVWGVVTYTIHRP